jgi:hypothetical protein
MMASTVTPNWEAIRLKVSPLRTMYVVTSGVAVSVGAAVEVDVAVGVKVGVAVSVIVGVGVW